MAKPTFTLSTTNKQSQLAITGDVTVQHANELKQQLQEAGKQEGFIHLAFDQAQAFDTAAIQLTYAFKKEMNKYGRKVSVTLPINESVLDLLIKTGITKIF